jgi:drug/metabolite transporter (DMT)-like permease
MVVEDGRGCDGLKPKHWLAFITLGVLWSASFLWIKLAVQEIGPFALVALRTLFGALTGILAAILVRTQWPRDRRTWMMYLLLGVTSVVIPFLLVAWGEETIDSALASILNASVPLFTIIIAHFFVKDDRISLQKVLGLLVGFAGVAVLLSKDLLTASHSSVLGQAAVIVASIFYAGSTVYARLKTQHVPALVRGAAPLMTATLVMWLVLPFVEHPIKMPSLPITWVAVLWLGILGSGVALVLWYYLLHEIGPTRTTLVSYIFPLGGVILGVIFLDEHLSWQLALGTLLIVASIVVVNWNRSTGEDQR